MKKIVLITLASLLLFACKEQFPGYSELDENHFKKMVMLGNDQSTSLIANYYALQVGINPDSSNTRSITYILVHPEELYSYIPSEVILKDINEMRQGEVNRYIVPGKEAYSFFPEDSAILVSKPNVVLEVMMERRFDADDNICSYFMHKAQEDLMDEMSAIKLCQSTQSMNWEDHGKVSITWISKTEGESIEAGNDVDIEYNTYWLDGTRQDSLTYMRTTFGKPGQLIPGLQYGLSFLKKGERALICMPSELAFGEEGSRTGIIPAKTPIYFDINVLEVKK
ncbi:MAG: FKBP-type peptidyl-prolyl cis-trans isomerase [Flavobacteriales bacterium]